MYPCIITILEFVHYTYDVYGNTIFAAKFNTKKKCENKNAHCSWNHVFLHTYLFIRDLRHQTTMKLSHLIRLVPYGTELDISKLEFGGGLMDVGSFFFVDKQAVGEIDIVDAILSQQSCGLDGCLGSPADDTTDVNILEIRHPLTLCL